LNILVIEDNPGDARLVREHLRQSTEAPTIHHAQRLEAGLALLTSEDIDVVLVDLDLPDSRGLETFTQLQSRFPHLPIVILTASPDEDLAREAVLLGAQDYLMKAEVDAALLRHALRYAAERKQAEQAILRAKEEWERTFDADPDLIAVLDDRYHIMRANRAMAQRLGVTPEECVGKVCYEVVHGTTCPPDFCPHRPSLIDGLDHTSELCEPRLGGDFIVSITPLLDEQGKRIGSVHVARDITDRKKVEEELRRQQHDLDRAQEVAHVGSWRLDVRINELTWSDETHRIFGIPKETPLTYEMFLNAVHPDDREYVDQEWTAALRGEPYDIEHRIVVDDAVKWVRERAELESDEQGTLLGAFGTVQDITELKQAEEALERLRTEFTGIVTHELKTPLTAIKGSAATALGSQRPLDLEESRELFQIIDEQSDRLRELMDNLLDVTRIEAGTLSVSAEATDLLEIIEEARTVFARAGGRHEVQLAVAPGMPRVHADRRRVCQVLTNLLNNAAAYSPLIEPITIAVERDPMQVTVQVRDRGRGIPREKLPLLFKKFSRVHDDTGRKLSGTGLGLAICKGIVEAHGGRIWADSPGDCGEGSIFSFTLPLAAENGVEVLTNGASRAAHVGKVRRPGEKTRVLAVDDEPQILRFLRRSLEEAGYQPTVTGDPSEVTRLVELEEPDLVLLDLMLPGTTGFELMARLREFSGVPVIFLTASDREEDAVRALREGADDYITKPFSPSELLARIAAALRRRVLPDVMEARPIFSLGDLTIDFTERRVTVGGQEVSLSATEYKILHQMATHAGRPLSYEHLLRQVWGPEYSQETELVRSFIRNLRRKLGDDAQNPRFILTERQVGYRMPKP
jgi:PAS domain S-box-containing protein